MRTVRALLVLLIISGSSASTAAKYVYGPPPRWTRFTELAENAITAELPAAKDLTITWLTGYSALRFGLGNRNTGYLSCGTLRTSNDGRGQALTRPFIVVIDQDRVKRLRIASKDQRDSATVICAVLEQRGMLPPGSLMGLDEPVRVERAGLTLQPSAQGARVVEVDAGSAAEQAGLRRDMLVKSVAGVQLAGLGKDLGTFLGSLRNVVTVVTSERSLGMDMR